MNTIYIEGIKNLKKERFINLTNILAVKFKLDIQGVIRCGDEYVLYCLSEITENIINLWMDDIKNTIENIMK